MNVCLKNIEKFVRDHPELFAEDQETTIIEKAIASRDKNGMISFEKVKEILGDNAQLFFNEIQNSWDHIQIWSRETIYRH